MDLRRLIFISGVALSLVSPAASQVKIACVGNSITAGAGLGAGQAYPDQLLLLLGSGYTVRNEGVSGTTMLKAGDAPYWSTSQFGDVFSYKPNIITIKLGTNDSKSFNWGPYHANYPVDYNSMIDTFLTISPRPQIWLILPAPAFPNGYGINGDTIHLDIVPMVKALAAQRGLPFIDCHTPLLGHSELFQDGVHPTAVGADTIANIIYRSLQGKPIVVLSDSLVTAVYTIGQSWQVMTKKIAAVNTIPGAVHLSGPLSFSGRSPWLTLSVDATNPDSQVIANTVDPSTFPNTEKKYYDTVTIHAGNGLAADLTYRVLVWIQQPPVLSSLSIVPGDSGALPSDRLFQFTAAGLDQYGMPEQTQPVINWSAIGGAIAQNGVFTPVGPAATAKVIATAQGSGTIRDTTTFSIVNCLAGLTYDYYNGFTATSVGAIGALTPVNRGTVTNLSLQPATADTDYAFEFTGFLMVPSAGSYTFYTSSDDGSALLIDGHQVVNNDGAHAPQEVQGSVTLGWGLHAITVLYFQLAGGTALTASWQGPGIAKTAIPDSMLFYASGATPDRPEQLGTTRTPRGSIDVIEDGLFINVPAAASWTLELYSLRGMKIGRHAGTGPRSLSLDKHQVCDGLVVARFRSGNVEKDSRLIVR